jgi:hypothetical protein
MWGSIAAVSVVAMFFFLCLGAGPGGGMGGMDF